MSDDNTTNCIYKRDIPRFIKDVNDGKKIGDFCVPVITVDVTPKEIEKNKPNVKQYIKEYCLTFDEAIKLARDVGRTIKAPSQGWKEIHESIDTLNASSHEHDEP